MKCIRSFLISVNQASRNHDSLLTCVLLCRISLSSYTHNVLPTTTCIVVFRNFFDRLGNLITFRWQPIDKTVNIYGFRYGFSTHMCSTTAQPLRIQTFCRQCMYIGLPKFIYEKFLCYIFYDPSIYNTLSLLIFINKIYHFAFRQRSYVTTSLDAFPYDYVLNIVVGRLVTFKFINHLVASLIRLKYLKVTPQW